MIENEEIPGESGLSPRNPRYVLRRTDHETKDSDPSRDPLDRGPTTSAGPSLGPSLAREAVGLEWMKKVAEKIRETTMNAGVVARMSVRDRHRSCKAQPSVDSPPPLVRCGNYFPCAEEESLNYEKNGETKGERPTNDRCGGKNGDREYCVLGIP